MKILFIGGNGNISWYCTQVAIDRGHEVWQLNREQTVLTRRKVQPEVHKIKGDMREVEQIKALLDHAFFDVVCDFICFNAEQARADIEIFRRKTNHFFFISSESVYQRDNRRNPSPYTERSKTYEADACGCDYIAGKLRAENVFWSAYMDEGFPVTVVRPAYTYDTIFPVSIGHNCFTAPSFIMEGYPLLVAGDGENRWPFTHSKDFAHAFVRLAENAKSVGECFHISTDELLSWNEQSEIVLRALHAESSGIFHVPYQDALELTEIQPREIMIQRMCDTRLSTSKLREFVPGWSAEISFEEGVQRTLQWLNEEPVRKRNVERISGALQKIYNRYNIMPRRGEHLETV